MAETKARILGDLAKIVDDIDQSGISFTTPLKVDGQDISSNTGVTAGTYGSASQVPVFTVNERGTLDSAGTVSVAGVSDFAFDSATGNVTISTADGGSFVQTITLDPYTTDDLTEGSNLYYTTARHDSDFDARLSGGTGVTVSSGQVSIGQAVATNSNVTFQNVTVQGDLQVDGTQNIINTQSLAVEDNMIYLNSAESDGSPTQFIDVGFAANYNDVGSYAHAGFFRDATDGVWKLFQGYTPEPDAAAEINTAHATFNLAPLQVSTLTGVYAGFDSDFTGKSTTDLSEGTNLYYTTARANSDFDTRLATKSTTNLSEGTNLYYTTTRANSAIDARVTQSFVNALNVDADTLDGISSASFLRSDTNDTYTGTLTITNADGSLILNRNGTTNYIGLEYRDTTAARAYIGIAGSAAHWTTSAVQHDFAIRSESRLLFASGGATTRAIMDASGNFGIGTSPSYELDVSGDIHASGEVIASSDVRLKSDINTIPDALNKVSQLRGVEFTKNDEMNTIKHIGLIAQEVEEVLPEVVKEDENGYKSVAYSNIVGLLIEAIKEQQVQIEELKGMLGNK